jgi:hypothetical protein
MKILTSIALSVDGSAVPRDGDEVQIGKFRDDLPHRWYGIGDE